MATFTNQATLSYQNMTVLSNVVSGELLEALSVTKTAALPTYGSGESVTYIVSLVNTGGTTLTGLSVTDDLGAYPFGTGTLTPLDYLEGSIKYYVNGTLQSAPTITADPLTFGGITVPAGGDAVLVYLARANAYAPLGAAGEILNTVTVSGAGLPTPITASETVTAAATATLAITKAISPSAVSEGDTLTYTLTVENYGFEPIEATGNAVVTDTFSPVLSPISVTLDGVPLTEGVGYTYNGTTGAFATLPGALTVPAATATQDPVTGGYTVVPGVATLVITGTVSQ